MSKYYKIITERSYFHRIYDAGDALWVPYGTRVSAEPCLTTEYSRWGVRNGQWYINSDVPVIHFCDNAFDTMLWHSVLTRSNEKIGVAIYEIKPLTKVIKQRCGDDIGLYQCGANVVQFRHLVSTDEMFERALSEFHVNHHAKIDMYPNLQMSKIIAAWVHHNQSKYVY